MRFLRFRWLLGVFMLLSASVVFGMGYSKSEIVDMFTGHSLHLPNFKKDIVSINNKSVDALKKLKGLDDSDGEAKPVPEQSSLWSCTCSNYTYAEQQTRGCSKGYAFNTMTAATQYTQSRCGKSCILHCNSDLAMREKIQAEELAAKKTRAPAEVDSF